MVFMQFKTYHDGHWVPLDVKVIDVGIGLERIPWLVNGSLTSYLDVCPEATAYLKDVLDVTFSSEIWKKFAPLSCLLNIDEVDSIEQVWERIAKEADLPVAALKEGILPYRDLFIICDHTRTLLIAIYDGSLPSNVGGASNLRNILRRTLSILKNHGWWEKLGIDGFLRLFEIHKKELEKIYGPFPEYKSFNNIIEIEFERWEQTELNAKKKLGQLMKGNLKKKGIKGDIWSYLSSSDSDKTGLLSLNDWILCVVTYGLDPELISELTGIEVPGKLFLEIADMEARSVKPPPEEKYVADHDINPTIELFYDVNEVKFEATVTATVKNSDTKEISILVLDRTLFYPIGGGQDTDTGKIRLGEDEYSVVSCFKVGHLIFHQLSEPLRGDTSNFVGQKVIGEIDVERRKQLMAHHTATHIVCAAARTVLGPHIWQNGAKKTVKEAHLDITHFRGLLEEEEREIELLANEIVFNCVEVKKYEMEKEQAEQKYGFSLYQGGVVPGNYLRIVEIEDIDIEACCGTHVDNTGMIGPIRLTKSQRISDGIVRIHFVARGVAVKRTLYEDKIRRDLINLFGGVTMEKIIPTAERFFEGYKKSLKLQSQFSQLLVRAACTSEDLKIVSSSDEPNLGIFKSTVPSYAEDLKKRGKSVFFIGETFFYGILPVGTNSDDLVGELKKIPDVKVANSLRLGKKAGKKKSNVVIKDIYEISCFSIDNTKNVRVVLTEAGFEEMKLN